VHGEIRPGGSELDWCDAEVLRRLKRGTLARLRDQVAPVDSEALARFLPAWQGVGSPGQGLPRLLEIIGQLEGLDLPWSAWQTSILPQRMQGFSAEMLDMLAATGQLVWIGRGPLGGRDGRVAIYLREHVRELLEPPGEPESMEAVHRAILDHLERRGASFLFELEDAVGRVHPEIDPRAFRDALWDLVWAGCISNDTFAPLRALASPAPKRTRGRARAGASLASGRWTLVAGLYDPEVSATERVLARTNSLLERYGVVSREMVAAERCPGGFGPVYKVLADMEASGRVRRGYFIEGLSGAQFARPAVVDRLRETLADGDRLGATDAPVVVAVPAIDPANPWGSLLPWPETGAPQPARPRRVAGAWLLLHVGRPLLYLGPGGRQLLTFPETLRDPALQQAALRALHDLPRAGRRRSLVIEKIDGVAVDKSPYHEALLQTGFVSDYRGLASEMAS
jgi:ATP-dependent Lhr-like helicase